MKKINSLLSAVCAVVLAASMIGCAEPDPVDTVDYGIKIGNAARIPFTEKLAFDSVVDADSPVTYNEDGSVSYTAKEAGGAGGGIAFLFNENADKSIINTKNYESCTIVLDYAPVEGKWKEDAQLPSFCLRLLTTDSTGIFGGAVDAEYFDTTALSGTLTYTVDFTKKNAYGQTLPEQVVDSADFDGIKGVVIKFNDFQRGLNDGDKIAITLKNITFTKKKSAKKVKDVPFNDGLKDSQRGTVENFYYATHDYTVAENPESYNKHAWVYKPAGYDETKKYPVLILLHGFGQNENTWGLTDQGNGGKIKGYLDRGIADGSVKPFIVVCATGVASKNWGPNGDGNDFNGFNAFKGELRDDLVPAIKESFAVYTDRDNWAIAGLSMGASQTLNIGMLECLDLFSYFGAFSFTFPSYEDSQGWFGPQKGVSTIITENGFTDYNINYLYTICGDNDAVASWEVYEGGIKDLAEKWDKLTIGTNCEYEKFPGGTHDFPVWFRGFKHLIPKLFK